MFYLNSIVFSVNSLKLCSFNVITRFYFRLEIDFPQFFLFLFTSLLILTQSFPFLSYFFRLFLCFKFYWILLHTPPYLMSSSPIIQHTIAYPTHKTHILNLCGHATFISSCEYNFAFIILLNLLKEFSSRKKNFPF